MTLKELCDQSYALALEKGWHYPQPPSFADFAANLHGEISEMWEAYRKGELDMLCDKAISMAEMLIIPLTCKEEEFADIQIRLAHWAKHEGVDLEKAVESKHMYNMTRSFRHGGKVA